MLNGLNLYIYCNNNPVMLTDESGKGFLDWLLGIISAILVVVGTVLIATGIGAGFGGLMISVGANSLVSGLTNTISGGSFTAGWFGGAVTGLLAGLSAGFAGSLILRATTISGLKALGTTLSAYAISYAGGFSGSIVGNMISNAYDNKKNDWNTIFTNASILGLLNIFAGYGTTLIRAVKEVASKSTYRVFTSIFTNLFEYISNSIFILINEFILKPKTK